MCVLSIVHKPEVVIAEALNKVDLKKMSSIELHLSDEFTYNIMDEKTAKIHGRTLRRCT